MTGRTVTPGRLHASRAPRPRCVRGPVPRGARRDRSLGGRCGGFRLGGPPSPRSARVQARGHPRRAPVWVPHGPGRDVPGHGGAQRAGQGPGGAQRPDRAARGSRPVEPGRDRRRPRRGRRHPGRQCARAVRAAAPRPADADHGHDAREAADEPELVAAFVDAGMDVARINCAHDGPAAWERMVGHIRTAARPRPNRARVDGPRRPEARAPAPSPTDRAIGRARVTRDATGRLIAPSRLWLVSSDRPSPRPRLCSRRPRGPRRPRWTRMAVGPASRRRRVPARRPRTAPRVHGRGRRRRRRAGRRRPQRLRADGTVLRLRRPDDVGRGHRAAAATNVADAGRPARALVRPRRRGPAAAGETGPDRLHAARSRRRPPPRAAGPARRRRDRRRRRVDAPPARRR